MKDKQMKALISDVNVLVYIHDVLSINDANSNFIQSDTYMKLHEKNVVTVLRYLQKTVLVILSFVFMVLLLKSINDRLYNLTYILYFIVSVIYGVLLISCKDDIMGLRYQLKAKKAVQYALKNYTYEEYVLFLDQYLSEVSSRKYYAKTIHNKKY